MAVVHEPQPGRGALGTLALSRAAIGARPAKVGLGRDPVRVEMLPGVRAALFGRAGLRLQTNHEDEHDALRGLWIPFNYHTNIYFVKLFRLKIHKNGFIKPFLLLLWIVSGTIQPDEIGV
jgi:hypothetical protein